MAKAKARTRLLPEGRGGPKRTGSAPLSLQGEGSTRSVGGEVSSASPEDLVVASFLEAPRRTATAIGSTTGLDATTVKIDPAP